jgi:uncharacterized protein YjcR
MHKSSSPDTATVAEAAEILGKHPNTVRKWCDRYAFGWRPSDHADWIIPRTKLAAVIGQRQRDAR